MATNQQTGQIALTLQHKLQDLNIKYESVAHQLQVALLENEEYQKEILSFKEKNAQLQEDNKSCTELMNIEETRMHFTHSLSLTLDHLDLNNIDLKSQVKEDKKLINELKHVNNLLQTENEKYKQSLLNQNEFQKKRESIHLTKKLDLGNKIKELAYENESLQTALLTTIVSQPDIDEKQIESNTKHSHKHSYSFSDDKDEIVRLKSIRSNSRNSNPLFSEFGITSPNSYSVPQDKIIDIYDHNTENINVFGYDSHDQQLLMETYDISTPIVSPRVNELKTLRDINNENKIRIKELQVEITKLKLKNGELEQKIDSGFKCVGFNWLGS
eukprot:64148_1